MGYHAFSIINDVFNKTGKRLFPFKIKEWLKLGLVNMLSGSSTPASSAGGSTNYNIPTPANFTASSLNPFTGMATALPFILPLVIVFPLALILLAVYLNSLFVYVFIDSVRKEETRIKESINIVNNKAWSLFKFKLLLMAGVLLIILLGVVSFLFITQSTDVVGIITYVIIIGLFLIPFIVFLLLLNFVLREFLIPLSYFKNKTIIQSWNVFTKLFKKNWVEIVFFFLALLLIDLVIIAFSVILLLLYVLAVLVLTIPILIMLSLFNEFWALIMVIIALLLISIYALNVLILPLSVFRMNYVLTFLGKIDKTIKY